MLDFLKSLFRPDFGGELKATPATSPTNFAVRIKSEQGRIIGTGILIDQNYILTCAHVIRDALNLTRISHSEILMRSVSFDFPLIQRATENGKAQVVVCNNDSDVAALRIDSSVGIELMSSVIAPPENMPGLSVFSPGFPANSPNGARAFGKVAGFDSGHLLLVPDAGPAYFAKRGFSGAPVWESNRSVVIGMLVSKKGADEAQSARAIPIGICVNALKGLPIYNRLALSLNPIVPLPIRKAITNFSDYVPQGLKRMRVKLRHVVKVTEEVVVKVQNALAQLLGIDVSSIKMLAAYEGSLVIEIVLPVDAAIHLNTMHQEKNPLAANLGIVDVEFLDPLDYVLKSLPEHPLKPWNGLYDNPVNPFSRKVRETDLSGKIYAGQNHQQQQVKN